MDILPQACEDVLKTNDHGNFTKPSSSLYPHQWLWDSAFAAIGWANIDTKRAQKEILSLFRGQWHNGMVPHMIFDMSPKYIQDRVAWRSWASAQSPNHVATSGITQPPMIAEAIWRVGQHLNSGERTNFFKKVLPKLIKYHEWLYTERDPHKEGLVLQIHPYETGFDNTPPWILQLREHSRPWWIALIENLHIDPFINVARRDTRSLPAKQRMRNIDALLNWDVVWRLRRKNYDINKILHRSMFAIEDVAFNSIFIRNNAILRDIAKYSRRKLPPALIANMKHSEQKLEDLWDDQFGLYFSRDFVTNKLIREPTIASLMPLYAGVIKKERADKLITNLTNKRAFWPKYPVPSVPLNVRSFDAERYWQGPTWVNTNWLLIDGLARMGYETESAELKESTLKLLATSGIWEYYNPLNGNGMGSPGFSWSAALALDLIKQN